MKKADKLPVVVHVENVTLVNCIIKSNNKASTAGNKSLGIAAIVIFVICAAALVVSRCCPELLSDYIRWIVSAVTGI